ncbi:MAG: carboxypeptidase-like regulatory domain-containing protein, partial [Chitinophagales bacterium]
MRLSQTQSFSTCMLKIRFTCSLLLFCSLATVFAQTGKTLTIEGTVVEQGTTEIIPFATIAIYQTKEAVSPVGGATTDFEGIYSFNVPFDTTTYSHIEVSYLGMNTRNIPFDLSTIKNDTLTIAIELNSDGVTLEAVEVIEGKAYKTPTLKMDKDVGATRDVADLERIMVKEVSITTSGVSSTSTGEYKMESSKAKKSANPAPYPVSESRAASSPSPDPSLFMADEAAYGDMSEVSSDDFMTATMEVEVTSPKKRKVSKGKADKNKERKEKPMDAPLDTPEPKAGILTAGEVNDYSKWNLWQDITTDEFKKFSEHWKFAPKNRYTLQLTTPQGNPIMNA